jgi:hypothetical protein
VQAHLIPVGPARFELYSETPADDDSQPGHDAGRVRRWLHQAREQWRTLVDAARMGTATSGWPKWRDTIVCNLAESLDEQRTMWALRKASVATVVYPSAIDQAAAAATLNQILSRAQRFHGQRLILWALLFVLSGVLFFVPGPNIVAYFFGFRAFGHLQSWRGARNAATSIAWTFQASDDLAELATLIHQSHGSRASRVDAIARRLHLEHLAAFFERAAA